MTFRKRWETNESLGPPPPANWHIMKPAETVCIRKMALDHHFGREKQSPAVFESPRTYVQGVLDTLKRLLNLKPFKINVCVDVHDIFSSSFSGLGFRQYQRRNWSSTYRSKRSRQWRKAIFRVLGLSLQFCHVSMKYVAHFSKSKRPHPLPAIVLWFVISQRQRNVDNANLQFITKPHINKKKWGGILQ